MEKFGGKILSFFHSKLSLFIFIHRAVIDVEGNGDLTKVKPIADYSVEQEYFTISEIDLMNVAVKIYDEGRVLSLVTPSGSHGTHVAGIAAAYFADHPELNGVAPGAQLVSIKIGDNRLSAEETGTKHLYCPVTIIPGSAMVRGLIYVINNKVDLINMSFGEPTSVPNAGRFIQIAKEAVNDHGVIFVCCAGNSGPALSTGMTSILYFI